MIRLVALIIAIALQFISVILAIRIVNLTKHRAPWIVILVVFVLMAINLIIKLIQFVNDDYSFYLRPVGDWLNVLIPFLLIVGLILIGKVLYSQNRGK